MIHSIVLVSGVQQNDLVIYIIFTYKIHILFHTVFHCGLSQDKFHVLYSRTLFFIHFIYTSVHLLIPNLEKAMATHSSVLAWRIPGRGSLVGCRLWGRTESDTTEAT